MKIELIKKSDLDGVHYYTTVNDRIVIGSAKLNKEEAEAVFKRIIKNKGNVELLEMIDCTIIED